MCNNIAVRVFSVSHLASERASQLKQYINRHVAIVKLRRVSRDREVIGASPVSSSAVRRPASAAPDSDARGPYDGRGKSATNTALREVTRDCLYSQFSRQVLWNTLYQKPTVRVDSRDHNDKQRLIPHLRATVG